MQRIQVCGTRDQYVSIYGFRVRLSSTSMLIYRDFPILPDRVVQSVAKQDGNLLEQRFRCLSFHREGIL